MKLTTGNKKKTFLLVTVSMKENTFILDDFVSILYAHFQMFLVIFAITFVVDRSSSATVRRTTPPHEDLNATMDDGSYIITTSNVTYVNRANAKCTWFFKLFI